MSAENEPVPGIAPTIRASHADREAVVARLQQASGEGRLTLAEFEERAAAAYAAVTVDQLPPLTADLPDGSPLVPVTPAAAPVGPTVGAFSPEGGDRNLIAVLGGVERKGRWRPGRAMNVVAVMGGADIDMREAELPGGQIHLNAFTFWGGIDITVPEGMHVEIAGGVSLLGGKSVKVADVPVRPELPVLRVNAWAVMGGIEIKSKPPRQPKPPKGRKKLDRA